MGLHVVITSSFFARCAEFTPVAAHTCQSTHRALTAGFPGLGGNEQSVLEHQWAGLRVDIRVHVLFSRVNIRSGIAESRGKPVFRLLRNHHAFPEWLWEYTCLGAGHEVSLLQSDC